MVSNIAHTVAVLGCGGFIGSHLLRRLLEDTDYHIEGIDTSAKKITHLIGQKRLTFHNLDIQDTDSIAPIIKRCRTVVSLAALCNPYLYTTTPIAVIESNYVKMYPIVKMCSENNIRLVHSSTSEVYGKTLAGSIATQRGKADRTRYELNESTSPMLLGPIEAQRWCYASAKQLLERTIFAYGFERNLDYTIIRPFNFIGPGMDYLPGVDGEGVPRVFACFMDALLHKKPLLLVDGGISRRCFTAIDDAVDAIECIIMQNDAARQQIFNIGNPSNETTIKDLALMMIDIFKELNPQSSLYKFQVKPVASIDFYGKGYEDSDRRIPSIDAITTQLHWKPKLGLEDTVRRAMVGFMNAYQSHLQ